MPEKEKKKGGGGHRCTEREAEERTQLVVDLMSLGYHDGQIKRTVAGRYSVSPRSTEIYLGRARQVLKETADGNPQEQRGCSLNVYAKVVRDPTATNFERIKAQSRIDRILGLEAPQRVEHSGAITVDKAMEPDVSAAIERKREHAIRANTRATDRDNGGPGRVRRPSSRRPAGANGASANGNGTNGNGRTPKS